MSALNFVNATLVVVRGLEQLGLSFSQLDQAVKKAKAKDREFALEDIEAFRKGADEALAGLDDAIGKAQATQKINPDPTKRDKKKDQAAAEAGYKDLGLPPGSA